MLPLRGSCRAATEGEAPNCANRGDARRSPPLPLRGISPSGGEFGNPDRKMLPLRRPARKSGNGDHGGEPLQRVGGRPCIVSRAGRPSSRRCCHSGWAAMSSWSGSTRWSIGRRWPRSSRWSTPRRAAGPAYRPLLMVKALLLQQWYEASDEQLEQALWDRLSFRRFVGLGLDEDAPDRSTISRLRRTLARRGVGPAAVRRTQRSVRGAAVERVFGTLKQHYGYRRVRYRGLERNTLELLFKCMAYNLRRPERAARAHRRRTHHPAPRAPDHPTATSDPHAPDHRPLPDTPAPTRLTRRSPEGELSRSD